MHVVWLALDADALLRSECSSPAVVVRSAPLLVVGLLLVATVLIIGACYVYRKKKAQWELVDAKGYDEKDRKAYDMEGDDL